MADKLSDNVAATVTKRMRAPERVDSAQLAAARRVDLAKEPERTHPRRGWQPA